MLEEINKITEGALAACRDREKVYRRQERERARQSSLHDTAPWRGYDRLLTQFNVDTNQILDLAHDKILTALTKGSLRPEFTPGGDLDA